MIKLNSEGLLPVITQDAATHKVLTLAYMSKESLQKTLDEKQVWFYSRSRSELWRKGESSGNEMHVKSVQSDCDNDAILIQVDPKGPACHTGETSCFHNEIQEPLVSTSDEKNSSMIDELYATIQQRKKDMPPDSYTSQLFESGINKIAQKVIEEAGETALAGVGSNKQNTVSEISDLLYHLLVMMSDLEITPKDVWSELKTRSK
tara:strand:- start:356 stop:970 length:615 start_codon:yes stop_codon:yes gene_type:complete